MRGFATKQTLRFACPNGNLGSGLTIVVGANNTGKSTVVEALRALAQRSNEPSSFTQGRRNRKAGDKIQLRLQDSEGVITELRSVLPGTSETEQIRTPESTYAPLGIFVLPSRRTFNPYFSKGGVADRANYIIQTGFPPLRTSSIDGFAYRLFRAQKERDAFNKVLRQVLDPVPNWTIDQHDSGQYFLKITVGKGASHTSEGLGEGLVSLLFIIDALYDSEPGHTIVIDEPELSLHPSLQRKLAKLISDYARDRQIVLATHSPYFVTPAALENGASIACTHLRKNESQLSQLSVATGKSVARLLADVNNPHILGLNAQEVFFLEDQVILVEGQEDVVFYQKVQDDLEIPLQGTFFGWGVGDAEKMELIARVGIPPLARTLFLYAAVSSFIIASS